MRLSSTLCLLVFISCCLAAKEKLSDNVTDVYTSQKKYDFQDKLLVKRQHDSSIQSSSTAPISTDPILALVIFVALSSILF
ncbi:unnamed protein product [Mucor circinelloides]|uniref:Uncharacterized protein n=1 Tax=Mucor circinelloides f. circinelloides (strain 1006PhL) TaxID=1220926 RepID=S2JGG3_MUCC1|nr:hypothetical protein HMPREF1544_11663 [Mucor circinelloides 1006PhL]